MTPINSLDSVLRAGLENAAQMQSRPVEGDKLADARAQVLQGTVATTPLSLQPNDDKFSFERNDPNDTDDARLTHALRALAEKFQAGQAAQAAVADAPAKAAVEATTGEETGRQLAYVGQWVGASTVGAPAPDPAPAPAPSVPPPSGSGSSGGSTSGSGSGGTNNGGTNNGNGYGRTR